MKKYVLLFCVIALFWCCNDTIVVIDNDYDQINKSLQHNYLSRSIINDTGYIYLDNPYSLDNMQEVYDIFSEEDIELEPTNLYVRFLPQDSSQLERLTYNYNLELFDYPLNIELEEDDDYIDVDLHNNDFEWLYTTVPVGFAFPNDIIYEILEECYIPEENEVIITGASRVEGVVDVEEAAYALLGYDDEESSRAVRGKVYPQGTISVYRDEGDLTILPVKGVKVRCRRFVKYSTTYTDEYGYYVMDSKFNGKPHYSLVFDNCKDFDIWGNWGPVARANYKMGKASKTGLTDTILATSKAWKWAVINNAGYDYYTMCEQTGISKPHSNTKILVMKGMDNSSAGMYRRINGFIVLEGNLLNVFATCLFGVSANTLFQAFRVILPDITIGTKNRNFNQIYRSVNHELAHASHFKTVGSQYWTDYITYIASYGMYGDGTGINAELCGIGEMWGYAVGEIQLYKMLKLDTIKGDYSGSHSDDWFKPHVIWDLYRYEILSLKEIYDCMGINVRNYSQLLSEMYRRYPSKVEKIKWVMSTYGLIEETPPSANYDSFLFNQFYTNENYTHSGNNLYVTNVFVFSGSNLVLQGTNSVTIDYPFAVEAGGTLVIRN